MSVEISAAGLGVRFLFDRAQRPTTPALRLVRRHTTEHWGLRDVSFSAEGGEAIALVGASGAGKSTLLRVIAGIFVPDTGSLKLRGRIGTLLSTDAGLTGSLTGRDNAALIATLAGLGRSEAKAATDRIGADAGLGAAYDRPVSSYSEGMRARVSLAAALHARPDILLLDEVHEALDHEYREIVERQTAELLARGGIVLAAGHDHPLLERLSTRALLLENGSIVGDGSFAEIQAAYFG